MELSHNAIFIMGIVSGCLSTCFVGGLIYTSHKVAKHETKGHDADTAQYLLSGKL